MQSTVRDRTALRNASPTGLRVSSSVNSARLHTLHRPDRRIYPLQARLFHRPSTARTARCAAVRCLPSSYRAAGNSSGVGNPPGVPDVSEAVTRQRGFRLLGWVGVLVALIVAVGLLWNWDWFTNDPPPTLALRRRGGRASGACRGSATPARPSRLQPRSRPAPRPAVSASPVRILSPNRTARPFFASRVWGHGLLLCVQPRQQLVQLGKRLGHIGVCRPRRLADSRTFP